MTKLHPFEDPLRRCLKLEEWPEADRLAWDAALAPGDLLDGTMGAGHHWCSATREKYRKGYGRWLTFLITSGRYQGEAALAERITPAEVSIYIEKLTTTVAPWTVWGRLAELLAVAKAIAPHADWRWLRRVAGRLECRLRPSKDKHSRLRPAGEIADWAYHRMDEILRDPPLRNAKTNFRDALIVALLITCPTMRLGNLSMIEIGKHLIRRSDSSQLRFAAHEMKARKPVEIPIPDSLLPYLGHYIETVRPALLGATDTARLWITRYGQRMTGKALNGSICKLTERAFGKPINPHLFRDCAVTTIALEDPKHIGIAPPILAHTDPRTTHTHLHPGTAGRCVTTLAPVPGGVARAASSCACSAKTKERAMRAAIYARYSSDLQSAASIEDQARLCRERVERDGGTVVETYTDAAISGGSMKGRAGMQALLADARDGRFDLVVAEALDRVSRDQEDVAGIYKRLSYADVALTTLAEGEISELHIGLKGTMNALFLKDLAQKTRRGQRGRVEAGCSAGGNSYGYQVVRRLLADGSAATGERQIAPGEAAIVGRIFEEYVRGLTPRRIATGLNADGIASPRGGEWNASTINGSRQRRNGILNNELYIGRIVWNRRRFVKDPDTGKRRSRLNLEHEWIIIDAPELRVIDDDLWDQTQTLKARFASRAGNKRQTKKRLLSGLIKCGCCGGGMTIARRDRYYCSARREKGTCDASHGIGVVEIEDRVLTGLRDILVGNELLLEEFTAEFRRELARLRKARSGDEMRLRKELGEVERSIARCVEFVTQATGRRRPSATSSPSSRRASDPWERHSRPDRTPTSSRSTRTSPTSIAGKSRSSAACSPVTTSGPGLWRRSASSSTGSKSCQA